MVYLTEMDALWLIDRIMIIKTQQSLNNNKINE
jgi:hypothetical protein